MLRYWPGFLAVWAAIVLHLTWAGLLLWPDTQAQQSTAVHELYLLVGDTWGTSLLLLAVAGIAWAGTSSSTTPGHKILYLLPQQLVLGISAAGAMTAMLHSSYADGVGRPVTFIIADQSAIVLTWIFHTVAILFLYLIHTHRMGRNVGRP